MRYFECISDDYTFYEKDSIYQEGYKVGLNIPVEDLNELFPLDWRQLTDEEVEEILTYGE